MTFGETTRQDDSRPFVGCWTYRLGLTVVLFGYGLAVGPSRTRGSCNAWQRDWNLVRVFRNYAYRGLRSGVPR